MPRQSEEEGRERLSVYGASTFVDEVQAEFESAFSVRWGAVADPVADLGARSLRGEHFDALLISLDRAMPVDQIEALPEGLRAIATYSVGTDHIDLEAAGRRGLAVLNTPGVLGDSVAENAIFLMLGAARRATESIQLLRSRGWSGWTPTQLVGVQLAGRRLGILGMGDIGRRVAARAKGLGMEVHYCNRNPLTEDQAVGARFCETPLELASESDVLLLAAPSTDETRGMINARFLEAAKPGSILVNIARGDLVDDDALIGVLRSGRIRAAGLDVFAGEPAVDPRYFALPNVFMLPHIGSSTLEARLGMGRILIEGFKRAARRRARSQSRGLVASAVERCLGAILLSPACGGEPCFAAEERAIPE